MKAICYFEPGSRRSTHIARAMADGIRACGDEAILTTDWSLNPVGDVAVAYGWGCPDLFTAYKVTGRTFVHIDLGWWDRKPANAVLDGFHKVVVGAREPTGYFRRGAGPARFARRSLTVAPWRHSGSSLLLAGMSAKSAGTRGLRPLEWEFAMIARLRGLSGRPVVLRPKPSWPGAGELPGAGYSSPDETVEVALADAWMAITLHSNVAIDALLAGVAVHAQEGVAAEFSTPLEEIETPRMPDGREALMWDLAWVQWTPLEMRSGECWAHLKRETPLGK